MSFSLSQHFKNKKKETRTKGDFVHLLDESMFFIALISPIMTIPQVLTIWVDGQKDGVSLISWVTYLFTSIFWVIYGIVHKEKLILTTNGIWIVINMLIIAGLLK
jgi:uncharacterized protein with PQ loop repeat